jgi:hypothetical protein
MSNNRRASFGRIAVALATFLVVACVMATGGVRASETAGGNTSAVSHFYGGTTNAYPDAYPYSDPSLCPRTHRGVPGGVALGGGVS